MNFRTIVIEDEEGIRQLLEIACRLRHHEVLAFTSPMFCGLSRDFSCLCGDDFTCCDFIITDQMMPEMAGLDFIELVRKKNCQISNVALVTASQSETVIERAKNLNCHLIKKPFLLNDILSWLEESERNVHQDRKLAPKERLLH